MNLHDILQDPAGRIAFYIFIYVCLGFFVLLLILCGKRVLRPMFEKNSGDDLRDYLKEIARVGKSIKPKGALWSHAEISKEKAILTFGKEGNPYAVDSQKKTFTRTVDATGRDPIPKKEE